MSKTKSGSAGSSEITISVSFSAPNPNRAIGLAESALSQLLNRVLGDPILATSGPLSYKFNNPTDDQAFALPGGGAALPVPVNMTITGVSSETFKVRVYQLNNDDLKYQQVESNLTQNGTTFTANLSITNPSKGKYILITYKMVNGATTPVAPCEIIVN